MVRMPVQPPSSEELPPAPFSISPLAVYRATPMQRVGLLKNGLNARDALRILSELKIPQREAFKAINLSRARLARWARLNKPLAMPEAERVLGVAKLIGQVQQMVEESGDPEGFHASAWISGWLVEPLPALGGSRPIELLDTMEGQAWVAQLLGQMQGGAYA